MRNFIGKTIESKYAIRERLGKGGMGSVYLVKDLKLDAFRAMKIIEKKTNDYGLDPLTEVNIMKSIQHPYLPAVMDVCEDNKYFYIVMELISGSTLDSVLKLNKKIDEAKVIKWAKDICDILNYLHNDLDYKIIYKDLKPSNIMVSTDGERITLIDFGISQIFDKDKSEKNIPIGTKGYAAPEQFKEETINGRADIYSLGVTLYNLLTGIGPNQFDNNFIPLREIDSTLSEGIEYIAYKCVQKNPDDRYQDVKSLLIDFENINTIGEEYEIKVKQKRNKVISYLCCAALSLGVGIFGWGRVDAAILEKYNELIDKGREYRKELDITNARESFNDAKVFMPKNDVAHYELVKNYIASNDIYGGIDYINKIIEKYPSKKTDSNYNYLLGKLNFLQGQGNYSTAYEYFENVKKEDEVDRDYKYLKNITKELSEYDKTGTVNKKNLEETLKGFESYIDSLEFESSTDSSEDDKSVLYTTLANVYQTMPDDTIQDKSSKQISVLEKAYRADNSNYGTMEYLARAYRESARDIRLKDKSLRDEFLKKSLNMYQLCLENVQSVDVLKNIGDLYVEAGNNIQAEETYNRMIEQYSNHYLGYVKMAGLKRQQGDKSSALEYLKKAESCSTSPENDMQYKVLKEELQ